MAFRRFKDRSSQASPVSPVFDSSEIAIKRRAEVACSCAGPCARERRQVKEHVVVHPAAQTSSIVRDNG